jgi:Winged helix DNA-binding domain
VEVSTALALRMTSLLLRPHPSGRPDSVAGVVEWFGAMQAQDLASGLWSLGVRLPGHRLDDVHAALERKEAIRTWPMRGTVHWVPPADARWMLDLMGVRALAGAAKRRETIGLTEKNADRGVEVLAGALAGGKRLTRAQCLAAVAEAGVDVAGQQGYHLLWYASQRGVTCITPNIGKEQTFALLDDWAPEPHRPGREEALGIVARRFFRSHGPATRADLARWTGLPMTDVKAGIAAAGDDLTTVDVDGTEMIVDPALLDAGLDHVDDWAALPGFDEYLLGYKDRSMMVDDEHKDAIIPGGNGVFQSTIVRAGRVAGIWKRTLGKKAVAVSATALVPMRPADRKKAEAALEPYAAFVGLPLQVRWAP